MFIWDHEKGDSILAGTEVQDKDKTRETCPGFAVGLSYFDVFIFFRGCF